MSITRYLFKAMSLSDDVNSTQDKNRINMNMLCPSEANSFRDYVMIIQGDIVAAYTWDNTYNKEKTIL